MAKQKRYKYPKYAVPLEQKSKEIDINNIPVPNSNGAIKELDKSLDKPKRELKLGRPEKRKIYNKKLSKEDYN